MSAEKKVTAKLHKYLAEKRYEFPRYKRSGRIKALHVRTRYGIRMPFDVTAYKNKRNEDEILFIECKGDDIRKIAQGYGQALFYSLLFKRLLKKDFDRKLLRLGMDPRKNKRYVFCFAFREKAYKQHRKVLGKLIRSYAGQGIRTYVVGTRNVAVKKEL